MLSFKFEIALLVPLAPVGVISKSSPGHGGSDVLDLLDSDGGESIVGEFHALVLFKKLIKQILVLIVDGGLRKEIADSSIRSALTS